MPREGYQERLDKLREDVLYMSEVVLERLRMGLDAIERKDEDLAWDVIEGDHEVNEMYLDLEGDCIDLATNLAEYSLDAERDVLPEVDVQSIGDATVEAVETAMDAYAAADPEQCYAIADRDDEIDASCEQASEAVARDLIEREDVDTEAEIQRLMGEVHRLLLTIRDLERVGDHAVNIAARTLYMVENDPDLLY
jgi:phosphate transport system protein